MRKLLLLLCGSVLMVGCASPSPPPKPSPYRYAHTAQYSRLPPFAKELLW